MLVGRPARRTWPVLTSFFFFWRRCSSCGVAVLPIHKRTLSASPLAPSPAGLAVGRTDAAVANFVAFLRAEMMALGGFQGLPERHFMVATGVDILYGGQSLPVCVCCLETAPRSCVQRTVWRKCSANCTAPGGVIGWSLLCVCDVSTDGIAILMYCHGRCARHSY